MVEYLLSVAFLSAVGAVGDPPDWEALRLPKAVRLVAIGYNRDRGAEPFDKLIAEIGPNWARSEQYLYEGSFGPQLFNFKYDTEAESIDYVTDVKRGRRSTSFKDAAISGAENVLTPMGVVRVAQHVERAGGVIETRHEDDTVVYSFAAPQSGMPRVEIVVELPSSQIREIRLPVKERRGLISYSDWRVLPDGSRHPAKVRYEAWRDEEQVIDSHCEIQTMELMDPAAGPTASRLPRDVQIVDEIRGMVTDGEGNAIGKLPGALPVSVGFMSWNRVVMICGVVLVVASGVLWQRRRMSVRRPA